MALDNCRRSVSSLVTFMWLDPFTDATLGQTWFWLVRFRVSCLTGAGKPDRVCTSLHTTKILLPIEPQWLVGLISVSARFCHPASITSSALHGWKGRARCACLQRGRKCSVQTTCSFLSTIAASHRRRTGIWDGRMETKKQVQISQKVGVDVLGVVLHRVLDCDTDWVLIVKLMVLFSSKSINSCLF